MQIYTVSSKLHSEPSFMRVIGIIPARYESKRFSGKALTEIDGISLIQRVYDQALKCKVLNELAVATDDKRIFDHVICFGKVVMTDPDHPSGTDRCLEAYEKINIKMTSMITTC